MSIEGARKGELQMLVASSNVGKSLFKSEEWAYTIYDRDGGEIEESTDTYETQVEAVQAADFWMDDWRYGSFEVYKL